MTDTAEELIKLTALVIEVVGILVMVIGTFLALGRYAFKLQGEKVRSFQKIREELGRAILLGLEILIAADIIATVVYGAEMEQILNLGLIILIRTFLSFTLEIEIEGKFPWKQSKDRTTGQK
ncbi:MULTISPECIES: DUF1622 domain-containing protein [Salegentibacter]|jgi:uncharacterized membrane protein|uniref:Uncharacterized membrane protein n=1 Tax=Salegentibacter agarivorans TaxID=345907 RepID=A0A1I2KYZ9_9FLAO|nr:MULTISPECIES: DUF1622 domain-containing protein [Salegentibacter]APS40329.1 hypothetical protein AO058_16235 [Salegentibacter sp. T436]MBO2545843.1 DUF1622 domain-containing protein [Salegentibacter sp. BDJ18]SFF72175.1 Uncharacterized membrane protein [Salegentibacter agarivorans]|tara:strand:+ start:1740 stop:2105 length:366 start_codon:yes stop_codon:yes gene_type:complete